MSFPQVGIISKAAQRLRYYDCWVFRDELLSPPPPLPAGEIVEVVDRQERFIAYAFYSPQSHIALRAVSLSKDRPIDRHLLRERLALALARRRHLTQTNSRRLVFSEADGLPGLIIDQYADYLVVQFRNAGMDRWRDTVVELAQELAQPHGILERSDKEFRVEEGLPPLNQVLAGTVPDRILLTEDDLQFWVDPHRGLKTGFYLDQRTARRNLRARIQPKQRMLDAFSYTGSLGISAAVQGAQVVCVEQEEEFLALAKENAALNGVADRMEFIAGNAFYWLEASRNSPTRFDWVLLDPPALAKSRTDVTKARQALHHLVVQALQLLEPGGNLVVSVCAYHLLALAEEIVRIAAADCDARLRVREQWPQAEDHPWILQILPTRYLTSWWCERDPSTRS